MDNERLTKLKKLVSQLKKSDRHFYGVDAELAARRWHFFLEDIRELIKENERLNRFAIDVAQDRCENANVPTTIHDALRQALHKLDPDHPILKQSVPSYGVWESQLNEIELLHQKVRQHEQIEETVRGYLAARLGRPFKSHVDTAPSVSVTDSSGDKP